MPSFGKSRVWPVGEKGKCDAFKHPGFGKQEFLSRRCSSLKVNIISFNAIQILYIFVNSDIQQKYQNHSFM